MSSLTTKVAKPLLAFLLGVLIVLLPSCEGLCQSSFCDAGRRSSETSECHAGAVHHQPASEVSSVGAVPNCGLRQLPAGLPVDSRTIQQRVRAANGQPFNGKTLLTAGFPHAAPSMNSTREVRLHFFEASNRAATSFPAVLRI